jgi:hypothetical protein
MGYYGVVKFSHSTLDWQRWTADAWESTEFFDCISVGELLQRFSIAGRIMI